MRIIKICAIVAPLTFAPVAAFAKEPEGPAHRGLLTRLALGFGVADAVNDGVPEIEVDGPAGFFSLDIGGTVAERLALHVRLSAHAMVSPTVSINGTELGEADDATVTFSLLGLGLTYYFPSNFYLTGVVGLAQATVEIAGDESESDTGFGLVGDLGYEWWVGGDWGLGIAGRLEVDSIPADPDRLVATAFGVLFTATYH